MLSAVSYTFSLGLLPERIILIDWERDKTVGESHAEKSVFVRVQTEGTTIFSDEIRGFDSSRNDHKIEGQCLIYLVTTLVESSSVQCRLDIVDVVDILSDHGFNVPLEPYTSRARHAAQRCIDSTPTLAHRIRMWEHD